MGKLIEKIKNLANIKVKTLFIIFLSVWTIDFLTTIYGVAILKTMIEANPIPAFFYNLGWYGWIIFYFISTILLLLLSFIVKHIKKIKYKESIKYNKKDNSSNIPLMLIFLFISVESFAIINNLYWMLS